MAAPNEVGSFKPFQGHFQDPRTRMTVGPAGSGWSRETAHGAPRSSHSFFRYLFMETPAFFYAVFLWFLLLSVTGYSIYVGFGPPSKELRDPFEDHED